MVAPHKGAFIPGEDLCSARTRVRLDLILPSVFSVGHEELPGNHDEDIPTQYTEQVFTHLQMEFLRERER